MGRVVWQAAHRTRPRRLLGPTASSRSSEGSAARNNAATSRPSSRTHGSDTCRCLPLHPSQVSQASRLLTMGRMGRMGRVRRQADSPTSRTNRTSDGRRHEHDRQGRRPEDQAEDVVEERRARQREGAEQRRDKLAELGLTSNGTSPRIRRRDGWPLILEHAATIVRSYGTRVTLRQLFYRLVSDGTLRNTVSDYQNLSSYSARARRARMFPSLLDRTSEVQITPSWHRRASWSRPPASSTGATGPRVRITGLVGR